jgi:hypothetical protein
MPMSGGFLACWCAVYAALAVVITFPLDLGRAVRPCDAVLFLGPYLDGYPRALRVDTSLDNATWRRALVGRGASLAIRGAIERPRDALQVDERDRLTVFDAELLEAGSVRGS